MTSIEEALQLYELARAVREGCVVEVGAYRGRTTVALGRGSIDGAQVPVFVIEPHAEFVGPLGGQFGPADAGAFYRAILDSGCYHVVRLVSLSSEYVTGNWRLPVSLLWLDGDHSYEGVKRDLECWLPHLAPSARVALDDADHPELGPRRVIDEALADGRFEKESDSGKFVVLRLR